MSAQPQPVARPVEKYLVRAEPDMLNLVYGLVMKNARDSTIPIETMSMAEFSQIYDHSLYYFWRDPNDVYVLVGLSQIDPQARQAEFGLISLVRQQGHAIAAFFALTRFAFRSMGMRRLWCRVNSDNTPCLAAITKAGALTQEGTLRQARFKDGQFLDQYQFSILASEVDKWGR